VPRENAEAKGRRYLTEGRLTLRTLTDNRIVASVRGDSARIYNLRWEPSGWWCDCDARGRCSHLIALQRVVLEPREAER
jgi:uncharacterized Zn finger protein